MNSPRHDGPEAARARLRATVSLITQQLSLLPTTHADGVLGGSTLVLAAAWAELVSQLDLGPDPELRPCPVCGQLGMRAATLCGFCWTQLKPVD
jgi:hypothetical protein